MQGLFFRDKAHEVDEESTQKIFESKLVTIIIFFPFLVVSLWFFYSLCVVNLCLSLLFSNLLEAFMSRNVETQDEMLLDLHEYGTKDAIRSLRSNLLLLSGIPCKLSLCFIFPS